MKLVIGLGNPGKKYQNNRHNAGHKFVEYLRSEIEDLSKDQKSKIKILGTDCFMNESGKFVRQELRNLGIKELSNLYIAHDDLDLPLGSFKIQFGVGPKVHNGIRSVERELGTKDFWRVRIGVDMRPRTQDAGYRTQGERYVLEDFTEEERGILENLFPKVWEELAVKMNQEANNPTPIPNVQK